MNAKLTARRVTFRGVTANPNLPAYDMSLTVLSTDDKDAAKLARRMMRDTFKKITITDISRG